MTLQTFPPFVKSGFLKTLGEFAALRIDYKKAHVLARGCQVRTLVRMKCDLAKKKFPSQLPVRDVRAKDNVAAAVEERAAGRGRCEGVVRSDLSDLRKVIPRRTAACKQ